MVRIGSTASGFSQVDLGVARGAELGIVERAAEQALDDAVIVGGREQRHFLDAEHGRQLVDQALEVAQAVGFVLAADQADAEFLEVFGLGCADRERGERNGAEKCCS